MSELSLRGLVKVYPFAKVEGLLFGRKRAKAIRQRQESQPYTTNEGVLAVQGFDLEIQRGEFIVLLGPSGCGKSTVLRMIAGLEEVSAGDILLDGRSIVELPPEQRDIAMIFQNYSLYPNYTVYENLAFPLKSQHVPREQLQRQVQEVAGLMELDEVLNRYPRELSGGQRQRIAIGRALVRRPRLFLMDEPFSNLDPVLRRRLRGLVKSLHQRLGATFVYVTHDQEEAFALGDRIVVMQNGRIEQTGPPRDLFNRPANLYTAAFVGTPPMNIIRSAALRRREKGWTVEALGQELPLPEKRCAALTPQDNGRRVILGVRPVHISMGEAGIPAVVSQADPVEAELHVHLKAEGQELLAVVPATRFDRYRPGERVGMAWSPQRLHLFDPETEARIL
jgi:multiple sugar transport system ATP-binding protein